MALLRHGPSRGSRPDGPGRALAPRQAHLPARPHQPPPLRMGRHARRSAFPARVFFILAMGIAFLGTLSVGTALAWSNREYSAVQTSEVGQIGFVISYEQFPNIVGPPDGKFSIVGRGTVLNTGDFNLWLEKAEASITGITGAPDCTPDMFAARVRPFGGMLGEISPERGVIEGYFSDVAVLPHAVPSCSGAFVSYTTLFTFVAR
jgi:hypothetical protein